MHTRVDGHPIGHLSLADRALSRRIPKRAQYLEKVRINRGPRKEEADRSECIEVNQNNRDGFKPRGEVWWDVLVRSRQLMKSRLFLFLLPLQLQQHAWTASLSFPHTRHHHLQLHSVKLAKYNPRSVRHAPLTRTTQRHRHLCTPMVRALSGVVSVRQGSRASRWIVKCSRKDRMDLLPKELL